MWLPFVGKIGRCRCAMIRRRQLRPVAGWPSGCWLNKLAVVEYNRRPHVAVVAAGVVAVAVAGVAGGSIGGVDGVGRLLAVEGGGGGCVFGAGGGLYVGDVGDGWWSRTLNWDCGAQFGHSPRLVKSSSTVVDAVAVASCVARGRHSDSRRRVVNWPPRAG